MHVLGFIQNIGGMEWLIILVIGLLLFGRRLPEVGRSLGKGIVEFKRGLKGIEDDVETESSRPTSRPLAAGGAEPVQIARTPVSASGEDLRVSRTERVVDETPAVRPVGEQ